MNVQLPSRKPEQLKLTVDDFLLLRKAGAFDDHWRPELLEGAPFASPSPGGVEPESDAHIPYKLRIEDYELLAGSGSIAAIPRTELVDGKVFAVSPQYRPHGFVKDELAYRLRRALEELGLPLSVATEQSVAIPPYSEPMPDVIVTTARRGPGAIPVASVTLIVEISTSTLRFDLLTKSAVYARAGVPEYWVVDVDARVIQQMWAPQSEAYAERREVTFGERVVAITVEGFAVETTEL
ncbi:MAG: Uma2 family endonuclease [Pseudomonadota bacterium]